MPQRSRRTSPSRVLPHPSASVAPARRRRTQRRAHLPARTREVSRRRQPDEYRSMDRYAARPAALVAVMLGIATAMVVVGLSARFQVVFADAGGQPSVVVGAALFALAVGVRVPHRFAVSVCTAAWRRFVRKGTTSELAGALIHHGAPDRALYWLVLAVIALAAGVAITLLPLSVSTVSAFYEWMNAHFLWSKAPLALLQTFTAFAAGVIPLAALGLSISCAHHLCCRFAQWEVDATAWILLGAAVGALLATRAIESMIAADPFLIAASLPALLVSIAAAFLGASGDQSILRPVEPPPAPLPLWSDRWPTLLRASIVAVGGGSACAVYVWIDPMAQNSASVILSAAKNLPASLLIALAIGLLGGARMNRPGRRTIGGFGAACNVAGVVVAIGAATCSSSSGRADATVFILACAALVGIGFATAYGRQTLLIRVASRSSAGAVELGRLLVCAGLTLLVGAPLAVHFFGPTATLIMLAVSLVALGGTLVIHDPVGSPKTRRIRLAALFVSMGTMLLLSLLPTNRNVGPPDSGSPTDDRNPVAPKVPAAQPTDPASNGR